MASLKVKNLVCDGNSITAGLINNGGGTSAQNAWPVVCRGLLIADASATKAWSVKSTAAAGDNTQARITKFDQAGGVRSLFDANYGLNVLTFFEAVNDFVTSGLTVDQVIALTKQYAAMAMFQGWTLMLVTPPRTTVATNAANTRILAFNDWLMSADGALYSSVPVLDIASDSRLQPPTNYQSDGLHPNQTGYGVIAELVHTRIAAL